MRNKDQILLEKAYQSIYEKRESGLRLSNGTWMNVPPHGFTEDYFDALGRHLHHMNFRASKRRLYNLKRALEIYSKLNHVVKPEDEKKYRIYISSLRQAIKILESIETEEDFKKMIDAKTRVYAKHRKTGKALGDWFGDSPVNYADKPNLYKRSYAFDDSDFVDKIIPQKSRQLDDRANKMLDELRQLSDGDLTNIDPRIIRDLRRELTSDSIERIKKYIENLKNIKKAKGLLSNLQ